MSANLLIISDVNVSTVRPSLNVINNFSNSLANTGSVVISLLILSYIVMYNFNDLEAIISILFAIFIITMASF